MISLAAAFALQELDDSFCRLLGMGVRDAMRAGGDRAKVRRDVHELLEARERARRAIDSDLAG